MATASPPHGSQENAGGMGARIRGYDWAATPLGPIDTWPPALRSALSLCENSDHAVAIFWGPEFRVIYNNIFAAGPAARHPDALNKPAREVFGDIWSTLGAHLEEVAATGKGRAAARQMLPTVAEGMEQDVCWTYGLTPIFDDQGKVLAIYSPGFEISGNIHAERRLSFQITLADRLRRLNDLEEITRDAAELLGKYLSASRVGYCDFSEDQTTYHMRNDWTCDPGVASLAGRPAAIDCMGMEASSLLRSGETLVITDIQALLGGSGQSLEVWEGMGVKGLIVVPLLKKRALKALLYVHQNEARVWTKSEAAIVRDAAERTWAAVERALAEKSLRESEDHYRHTVELNPQVAWTALPDGLLNRIAGRWKEWTGQAGLGLTWLEQIHPEDRAPTLETWNHSVATGQPFDVEHRIKLRDGSYRWCRSRAFPYEKNGKISLWYGSTEDVHERKVAEEHQRLLINELNHRVKNTLATVQAIAFQTFKGELSLSEARDKFEARLLALSHAHNLLTEQHWERVSLKKIITGSVAHLAGNRIEMKGEDLWLNPRAALALSLAFHELATNAAKYGAWSSDAGMVSVLWETVGGWHRIQWLEKGGPMVRNPQSRGFGSRLIERSLAAEFEGTSRLDFDSRGLRCHIDLSLQAILASGAEN